MVISPTTDGLYQNSLSLSLHKSTYSAWSSVFLIHCAFLNYVNCYSRAGLVHDRWWTNVRQAQTARKCVCFQVEENIFLRSEFDVQSQIACNSKFHESIKNCSRHYVTPTWCSTLSLISLILFLQSWLVRSSFSFIDASLPSHACFNSIRLHLRKKNYDKVLFHFNTNLVESTNPYIWTAGSVEKVSEKSWRQQFLFLMVETADKRFISELYTMNESSFGNGFFYATPYLLCITLNFSLIKVPLEVHYSTHSNTW